MAKHRRPPKGPDLRRRGSSRGPLLRIVIYMEGKNTEPQYFERFAVEHGNSRVEIDCVGGAGVPATLVDKAKARNAQIRRSRNSFEREDQVWVIFDEDEHPDVQQSIQRARGLGVKVGYSNPCFEVWLLLHHGDHDNSDDRRQVQRRLGLLDPGYKPTGAKEPTYPLLSARYSDAKRRAEAMRARRIAEGDEMGRPYTDIDLLTEIIIANGRAR